jgi:hypothetical protein
MTALRTLTMCWAGKHFEMPTGIKNGDKATAMATKITARATSFVSIASSPYLYRTREHDTLNWWE